MLDYVQCGLQLTAHSARHGRVDDKIVELFIKSAQAARLKLLVGYNDQQLANKQSCMAPMADMINAGIC